MAPVKMYSTAVCPYCVRAEQLLLQRGVTRIDKVRVDLDPERRHEMVRLTGRRTVPQIFIGETYVGGCDELIQLDRRGGLQALLQAPSDAADASPDGNAAASGASAARSG
jgi:glutaredoxin 3